MSEEAATRWAGPYPKIVEDLPRRLAVSEGRRTYVFVNDRSEGNAPLTVHALSKLLYSYVPLGN
ncbi:MAG: hypothetical protein E6K65_05995 [Nitrospirae bacterium]|nr:MAG: hypothetical protein E6K65_05995 [Nitrospirota bacterium]